MSSPTPDLEQLIGSQRRFFATGKTLSRSFRDEQLRALQSAVQTREQAIIEAVRCDMGRPEAEAYLSEVGIVLAEVRHARKHLKQWMKARWKLPPVALAPSSGRIYRQPHGVNLIIAPWNYPVLLILQPLTAAIAAGNTAVCKPSELAPASSQVVGDIVASTFSPEYLAAVQGGADVAEGLLAHRWDHIFFTGGMRVGRIVAEAGARHLTPTTLELGGKTPTIVMASANLDVAIKRIVSGKFFNAGQSCVAPDYLLVEAPVYETVLEGLARTITEFFGARPQLSPDLGRIVNRAHVERLSALIDRNKIVCGGEVDIDNRYIAPTVLRDVDLDDPVMREEVFGPILPVLKIGTLADVHRYIDANPDPLSLYLFSSDEEDERYVVERIRFGGGCINNTLVHFVDPTMPFGGVGRSGYGRSHGEAAFNTFSVSKSINRAGTFVDPPMRYAPYAGKLPVLRRLLR